MSIGLTKDYLGALASLKKFPTIASSKESWAKNKDSPNAHLEQFVDCVKKLNVNISSFSKNSIHVAGTKGKGSTCANIESILRHHGFSTGLYTSPHLVKIEERFKLNGKTVSEELFAKYFWITHDTLFGEVDIQKNMSLFNFLTAMAFKMFQEEKVEVAIMEVGIGGRTCPTNIMDSPAVCGITSLGYDHTELLGETIELISSEKAGIIKEGTPIVTVDQLREAKNVIIQKAKEKKAPLFITRPWNEYLAGNKFELSLKGEYQHTNASLAVAISHMWLQRKGVEKQITVSPDSDYTLYPVFPLSETFIKGLQSTNWPGRSQILPCKDNDKVTFYLDGAHTDSSLELCMNWFLNTTKNEPNLKILCFTCKEDKPSEKLINSILKTTKESPFNVVIFTNPRAKSEVSGHYSHFTKVNEEAQQRLKETWGRLEKNIGLPSANLVSASSVEESVEKVLDIASKNSNKSVQVMVTGSLYLVGATLEYFNYVV